MGYSFMLRFRQIDLMFTGYTWVSDKVYRVYMSIQGIQGDKQSITITCRIYVFGVSVT